MQDEQPTGLLVFYDAQGEVQIGTAADLPLHEMELMLEVATAKVRLLQWKVFEKSKKERRPDIVVPTIGMK